MLGPWMTLALVIGGVVGSGIFYLPIALAPLGGSVPIGWLISGVGIMAMAYCASRIVSPDGGGLQAYVGITVKPRSGREVLRRLTGMAEVQVLCAVSGEFDYVAWLRADSPERLDELLDLIGSVDGVEKTTTSIILSCKIDRGQPLAPA